MTLDDVRAADPAGMYDRIRLFPDQVEEAVRIGHATRLPRRLRPVTSIVLSGMGGSAIGGDLLRTYLRDDLAVPFIVNRHYDLPAFVGPGTLVIVSSYSGNTEETISSHRQALRRKAQTLCITSGGATATRARRSSAPLITLPGGSPPRAALGYSFFPLLIALGRLGLISPRDREIRETIAMLRSRAELYGRPDGPENPARDLAAEFQGKLGVVYAGSDLLEGAATRWRGQLNENSKTLALSHVLPEMNHNEIVGWNVLEAEMRRMPVVFLRDRGDHPRVQRRIEVTRDVLAPVAGRIIDVWSEGRTPLTRLFSIVYLGDWVSLYLAVLHRRDPTPVAAIDRLKRELAQA